MHREEAIRSATAEPATRDDRIRVYATQALGCCRSVEEQQAKLQTIDRKRKKVRKRAKGQMVVASVPELDPNAAGLALVLLIGGTLLLVDRRRVRV